MINIAICDDNLIENESISKKLSIYFKSDPKDFSYQIQKFFCAEDLLRAFERGEFFDILLLDIFLTGKTGIATARQLRKDNYKGQIIFLTSSSAHALSAFEVNAVQYLIKPFSQHLFASAMDKALTLMNSSVPRSIILRSGGEDHKIFIDYVVYVETNAHYQEIHLANGTILSVRSTATALFEILNEKFFIQIGKSYIVNFNFIKKINPTTITLNDETPLFLPRNSYQKIKEQYFDFFQNI